MVILCKSIKTSGQKPDFYSLQLQAVKYQNFNGLPSKNMRLTSFFYLFV